MKKLSQKLRIFSFIKKHPNASNKFISESLGIKNASVRARISDLKTSGKIFSVRKLKTRKIIVIKKRKTVSKKKIKYYRKIAKGIQYCENRGTLHKGSKEMIFSITYENNKISRFAELIDEAEKSSLALKCHILEGSWGYDDLQVRLNPRFTYPEIRVGSET